MSSSAIVCGLGPPAPVVRSNPEDAWGTWHLGPLGGLVGSAALQLQWLGECVDNELSQILALLNLPAPGPADLCKGRRLLTCSIPHHLDGAQALDSQLFRRPHRSYQGGGWV